VSPFPTKILLATDGSKEAALAARTAIDLADKTESELHVVYVEPRPPIIDPKADVRVTDAITEKKMKRAKKFVDAQVRELEAAGGTVTQAYTRKGGAAEEIVALAEEMGAGLIVVGSRGWTRLRWALMGSVSESVVHYAHCPVLVVRQEKR
jgi:nucleotide-binding universal stress UspA family protein